MVQNGVTARAHRREASTKGGYRGWVAVGVVLGIASLIAAIVRVLTLQAPPELQTSFEQSRTSFVVIFAIGIVATLAAAAAAWARSTWWIAGAVVAVACLVGASTIGFGIAGTDSRSGASIGLAVAAVVAWLLAGSALRRGVRPT